MITISYDETQHPGQPDGIADDSNDLPHLADAAKRVNAYIEETGDGLYDSTNGRPLYARDLESIRRAALASLADGHPTPYRLSPDGVLARRAHGGPCRHTTNTACWVVLDLPSRTGSHFIGQHLTDQRVAGWSPLIRKNTSGKDSL